MKNHGFTLLELIITIALAAILLGLAVPNMRDFIQNNRMTGQTNEFVTALNIARSEALKRNHPVSICPVNEAGTGCTGNDWSVGWLVYVDDQPAESETTAVEPNGEVRVWPRTDQSASVTTDPDEIDFVRYLSDGKIDVAALALGNNPGDGCGLAGELLCFVVMFDGPERCRGGNRMDRRRIILTRTGRSTADHIPCSD